MGSMKLKCLYVTKLYKDNIRFLTLLLMNECVVSFTNILDISRNMYKLNSPEDFYLYLGYRKQA